MQQQIFDMLLKEEEVSWKTIIYDLVKTEQMDPWNLDVTLLTKKYINIIKEMQEHDLRISGKVLLAAAVLLKIKSTHLVENDISKLDALINQEEEELEDYYEDELGLKSRRKYDPLAYTLIPRNPQERNRKVSVDDLVNALQRAMASKKRVLEKMKPVKFKMPERKIDIMEVIRDVFHKVVYYSKKEKKRKLSFSKLLPPRASKEDKVYTFLPLLHLENQNKVAMEQNKPFSEIQVSLNKKKQA